MFPCEIWFVSDLFTLKPEKSMVLFSSHYLGHHTTDHWYEHTLAQSSFSGLYLYTLITSPSLVNKCKILSKYSKFSGFFLITICTFYSINALCHEM